MTDIEKVYTDYFDTVYRYVLGLSRDGCVADEITQETFFKALKNLNTFKGQCKLSVWLCQIAKNCYFTYLEKEKRKGALPDEAASTTESLEAAFALQIHQIRHELAEQNCRYASAWMKKETEMKLTCKSSLRSAYFMVY